MSLVKENLQYRGYLTTCTLYEDFCPNIDGTQYLLKSENGAQYEVWNIINNNHVLLGTTIYSSNKMQVDALCGGPYFCQ